MRSLGILTSMTNTMSMVKHTKTTFSKATTLPQIDDNNINLDPSVAVGAPNRALICVEE